MTRQQLLFVTSAGQGLAAASDQLAFGKTLALGFHLLPQACTTALPARYKLQDGKDCTGWSGRTAAVLEKQTLAFSPVFRLSRHCSNGFLAQQQAGPLQLHNSRPSAGNLAAASGQVASFASSSALAAEPAAAPPPLPNSSSSSSATRQQLEQQYALQPPWLGFDVDVAGFSKKGYMRGGGKEQNQDRGLIMQQFRSPGELLLGVMDGHGPFGHLVSTFLIQHLPAVLMQKVVAAAAGAVLQGNSSSQPWELQQQTGTHQGSGKRQSKQQQQQSMQQQQQHPEMLLGSQLPYVVIPDHRGEAGGPAGYATAAEGAKASVANSSKRAQARNGRAVSKHQVVAQPEHTACYSLQDSPSSSSRHADAAVAVPKAIVDKVPICQSLLTNVFAETDHMLTSSGINTLDSGSTALLCHVGPDRISTAWVGDSRAVLGRRVLEPKAWDLRLRQQQRSSSSSSAVTGGSSSSGSGSNEGGRWQAIPLSDDHKPERPDEQLRIVLNDGRVQQMTNRSGQGVGPFRVWFKQLDYPGLAMSRAFGDTPCRRIGVTVEPELYIHRLTPQDELLVVASDGVWEYLSNEQVVEIAGRAGSAEGAARRVVEAAEAAWRAVDGGHYVDDITAVVLRAAPRGGGGGRPVSKL